MNQQTTYNFVFNPTSNQNVSSIFLFRLTVECIYSCAKERSSESNYPLPFSLDLVSERAPNGPFYLSKREAKEGIGESSTNSRRRRQTQRVVEWEKRGKNCWGISSSRLLKGRNKVDESEIHLLLISACSGLIFFPETFLI